MTAAAVGSRADSKIFKQSESTAAERTWSFHLAKTADQADATGLVPVMTISKAGGAFAAVNVGTAITELTGGWYKVVHAAADLDTIGDLAVNVAVATADSLNMNHQIVAKDLNDAATLHAGTATAGGASTMTLAVAGASAVDQFYEGAQVRLIAGTGAGQTNSVASYVGSTRVATMTDAWATAPDNTTVYELTAAPRALATAAAVAAQTALLGDVAAGVTPLRRTSHALGTLVVASTPERTSALKSLAHAVDAVVYSTGVYGAGASIQVYTTEDGSTWTAYGSAMTAAGNVPITEAHYGVKAVLASGDGSTAVAITLAIRTNQ